MLFMSTAARTPFILAATLALVPACDEEFDAALLDEEELSERCSWPPVPAAGGGICCFGSPPSPTREPRV